MSRELLPADRLYGEEGFLLRSHMEVIVEKISGIVRGNPRVASADVKNSAPLRPGTPSFGRPVSESAAVAPRLTSTASRAAALHESIVEGNKAVSQERVLSRMADDFFMSRVKEPAAEIAEPIAGEELAAAAETPIEPPTEYTPRGSFVDVHA